MQPLLLIFTVVVPPLDQLYATDEIVDLDAIENKWEILGWIMSFTEFEVAALRNLKKDFRLICAVLCALVKVNSMPIIRFELF